MSRCQLDKNYYFRNLDFSIICLSICRNLREPRIIVFSEVGHGFVSNCLSPRRNPKNNSEFGRRRLFLITSVWHLSGIPQNKHARNSIKFSNYSWAALRQLFFWQLSAADATKKNNTEYDCSCPLIYTSIQSFLKSMNFPMLQAFITVKT